MRQLILGLIVGFFMLAGCSKATPENYQKIEVGMKREQVHQILGNPTKVEGEVGTTPLSVSVETWNNDPHVITITYEGDVVGMKSASSEEQKK